MKSVIIALCVVGCAYASSDPAATILRSSFEQSPEGSFQYAYETDNGISAQADGQLKQVDKDSAAVVITGSNQFKSPEGEVFSLTYVADENGYHPQADFLPTPPPPQPIPEYIVRSIAYNAAHSPPADKKYV